MAMEKGAVAKAPAPTYREPFGEFRSQMDQLFDNFTSGSLVDTFPGMFGTSAATVSPHTDIKETEKEIVITSELPGIAEDDVSVTLQDGVLSLKGEKKSENKEESDNYRMVERRYGSFERSFRLPDTIDEDKVDAKFNDGVLKISVAKKPEAQHAARKIKIAKAS